MLKGKIQSDLLAAVKKREEFSPSVLRLLLAAIFNKGKEKRYKLSKQKPELEEEELEKESQLTDEEVIEVISSEIKKKKEAIFLFEKGLQPTIHPSRKKHIVDLVEKEKRAVEILQTYLPKQLSEEEIKKLVEEVIEKVEAKELKDTGKVMAELMPKVKGRAEGGLVSKIVKELLTPKETT